MMLNFIHISFNYPQDFHLLQQAINALQIIGLKNGYYNLT